MHFWIPWLIDLALGLGFLAFFIIGLGDGSVSSFNIGLWAAILLGLGAILFGSLALSAAGHPGLGLMLALVGAVPGAILGLFFLILILVPAAGTETAEGGHPSADR